MELRTNRKTIEALLECEILEIRNPEGDLISLEEAEQDPEEVTVHSSSGKVFTFHIEDSDLYLLEEEVQSL